MPFSEYYNRRFGLWIVKVTACSKFASSFSQSIYLSIASLKFHSLRSAVSFVNAFGILFSVDFKWLGNRCMKWLLMYSRFNMLQILTVNLIICQNFCSDFEGVLILPIHSRGLFRTLANIFERSLSDFYNQSFHVRWFMLLYFHANQRHFENLPALDSLNDEANKQRMSHFL